MEGSRNTGLGRRREERSTRFDTKVTVLAHTEGGLSSIVENDDFFRCMIRGSGRKGFRNEVGAVVMVDRVETTF